MMTHAETVPGAGERRGNSLTSPAARGGAGVKPGLKIRKGRVLVTALPKLPSSSWASVPYGRDQSGLPKPGRGVGDGEPVHRDSLPYQPRRRVYEQLNGRVS